ncbi:L-histidine N(alpha)-methyltransferase [Leptothoe kymatousa]|uniref:L-histidine N(Alpha)-methyltransferase n=1 Tax=Leptothoe kymatousa TAU-MAC 1615 TaxID=2364775 RepID=A0ABS5Y8W5_9CYAN|nr:L-histidine N(alpha)-methyltransferase [Leptothoe kymatousa]MBT9313390.1 L-histidine N(alpha)-methyltransferase [Leptothoe kymatousa TAU-MAC 1615]
MASSTIFNSSSSASTAKNSIDRLDLFNLSNPSTAVGVPDGQDVIHGLTQQPKSLPPKYFYDQQGSELFEQICMLPEYYPTRTEASIFQTYAEQITQLTGPCELVELGSGSATKTRILLSAYAARDWPLRYVPIDVSGSILQESSVALLEDYPSLGIHGLIGTYEPALNALPSLQLPTRMVMFIGSTLGNLPPLQSSQFLQRVGAALAPGQFFLLGLDLQKELDVIEAAYNDAQGVTAAFNLNMLRHLNYRYDGDFCLDAFRHVALYNEHEHQIEMYLESQCDQSVSLKQLDLTVQFGAGERLLTEISRKFSPAELEQQLASHGLKTLHTFTDERNWFGLMLAQKV